MICIMYLGSEFLVVLLSVIISVPICKVIMNYIYPHFVSHTNSGMACSLSLILYVKIV